MVCIHIYCKYIFYICICSVHQIIFQYDIFDYIFQNEICLLVH